MSRRKSAQAVILAAGSLAAVPASSSAATIYSGIRNLTVTSSTADFNQKIEVDLDGNGSLDLGLFQANTLSMASGSIGVPVDSGHFYAQSIGAGQFVGPVGADWKSAGFLAGVGSGPVPVEGPWAPPTQTGTLGFAFSDAFSATYYGWARVTVDFDLLAGTGTATLIEWAYQNQAGTPIQTDGAATPEPSTLSLLALGAAGLAVLRARRKKA